MNLLMASNFNYIDIAVIAILAIGLIVGFIGKMGKKIFSLIATFLGLSTSFFLSGYLGNFIANKKMKVFGNMTVFEFIKTKAESIEVVKNIYDKIPLLDDMILCAIKIFSFLIFGIIAVIALRIIMFIISSIIFKGSEKKAYMTFGLVGLLNAFLIVVMITFPLAAFSPITNNLTKLTETFEGVDLEGVENQFTGSKVLSLYDNIMEKKNISLLTYNNSKDETDTKKYYFVSELKGTVNLAIFSIKMSESTTEGGGLLSLSEDELNEIFASIEESGTAKEVLKGVFEEFDLNVNIDNVDLTNEGKTVAYVLNIAQTEDYENIDIDELVENIYDSPLVITIAETNEGLLEGVDEDTELEIKNALASKVSNGDMSQKDMDSIMYLFKSKEIGESERND